MTKQKDRPDLPLALELQDRLDDLLGGFRFWKEHKCASMELTTLDEMLIRWVDHNQLAESED